MRGILRGFGLRVGKTTPRDFACHIRELVAGHPNLKDGGHGAACWHAVLLREFQALEKRFARWYALMPH